ncbi:MAG: MBL fold metallo-hydrolase [bacterium]|jgi:glyoxylase-like metal-dependent hydrolase (beta-lactamase superfamily II)
MDEGIGLPSYDIAPLDHVAEGVTGLRILMVNVFAVSRPDHRWVLIDAGLPFSAARIRRWVEEQHGETRPEAIVLTHAHFDHVGGLRTLADYWDVPVYAHTLELPYLTGRSKYPPPDSAVGGGLLSMMAPLYPRRPIDVSDRIRELPADRSVPGLPGWSWIATPGHTPGHVSFFRGDDRVLIAGDAFTTTNQASLAAVATQRPEIHGPPPYYTQDWDAAKLSVARLAALSPNVVAPGHGRPMAGAEMQTALQYLADNFDRVARPAHGRYVHTPAVASERGLVSVPPAPGRGMGKVLLGAALASMALYGITRWSRR